MISILAELGALDWPGRNIVLSEKYFASITRAGAEGVVPTRLLGLSETLGEPRQRYDVVFHPGVRFEFLLLDTPKTLALQTSAVLFVWVSKVAKVVAAGVAIETFVAGDGVIADRCLFMHNSYIDLKSPHLATRISNYADLITRDLPDHTWISLHHTAIAIDANITFGGRRPAQVHNVLFDNVHMLPL